MENGNNPHPHSPDESEGSYLRSWENNGMELEVSDTEFRSAYLTMQRLSHVVEGWTEDEAAVILTHSVTSSLGALGRMLELLTHEDVCPYCSLDALNEFYGDEDDQEPRDGGQDDE